VEGIRSHEGFEVTVLMMRVMTAWHCTGKVTDVMRCDAWSGSFEGQKEQASFVFQF
jgi:hypothetical protein